jgi:hypothetical protein
MASTALARATEEIAKLRARTTAIRARAERATGIMQRDAVTVAGAYAFGAWSRHAASTSTELPSIGGIGPEATAVAALYAVSHFADGKIAELAHDVAVGIACGAAMKRAETP